MSKERNVLRSKRQNLQFFEQFTTRNACSRNCNNSNGSFLSVKNIFTVYRIPQKYSRIR